MHTGNDPITIASDSSSAEEEEEESLDDSDLEELVEDERRERVLSVQSRLPPNFRIMDVSGNHRKACTECGQNNFFWGDFYVTDVVQPWGADKICMYCIDSWLIQFESSEEESFPRVAKRKTK
eukprot:Nk52_evm11s2377 gene=Nk52_evmTU11s2377